MMGSWSLPARRSVGSLEQFHNSTHEGCFFALHLAYTIDHSVFFVIIIRFRYYGTAGHHFVKKSQNAGPVC